MHYHGTPITPRDKLYELAGRNFCVSYVSPQDVRVVHEIGQSVMLDNGAFTFWRQNLAPDWAGYYEWADKWLVYPTTWAVIPDVVDGGEEENDRLLDEWPLEKGAPVWHLHESFERLQRLVREYPLVCFGSSGIYHKPGSPDWCWRVDRAFDVLCDDQGRVPPIHMLRGLKFAGSDYPFASADSANVARNHAGSNRRKAQQIVKMANRIDAKQCPAVWRSRGEQLVANNWEVFA